LNDGRIRNPSNPFGILPLSNFVPRGFGFVHHSIAIFYHQVPNPNLTIRNFFIAVSPWPRARGPTPGRARSTCRRRRARAGSRRGGAAPAPPQRGPSPPRCAAPSNPPGRREPGYTAAEKAANQGKPGGSLTRLFNFSRRPPISLNTSAARTHMCTYSANVWDLSIVQDFSVAPCQTLNVTIRDFCIAYEECAMDTSMRPPNRAREHER
jgi:hypothetical protein